MEGINSGGINGTGEGVVNTNSQDFLALREAIKSHAKEQTPLAKIRYELVALKFQMQTYVKEEKPLSIIRVGEFLKKHIRAMKIKNKEFAKYIELEETNLSSIIIGRRKMNTDLAFKLGQLFKVDPNLWLLIQSKNELLKIDNERRLSYQKFQLEDLLKKVG